jgi:hypothetical protein
MSVVTETQVDTSRPCGNKLTVICFGRIELPEDDPMLGTYSTGRAANLGSCTSLDAAITLAEQSIGQPGLTLITVPTASDFAPERINIRDSASRLVLAGEITRSYLVWFPPVTSDDETYTFRAVAKELRNRSAFEHGWDNYSTARSLERRAEMLEGHLVDPLWQEEVTNTLKRRANSSRGLARTPLGTRRKFA